MLTFRLKKSDTGNPLSSIELCETAAIPDASWKALAADMSHQNNLTPMSPKELKRHWHNGLAAVALEDDAIIGYARLYPCFSEQERSMFESIINVPMPWIDILQFKNAWVTLKWRKKNLCYTMYNQLSQVYEAKHILFIIFSTGMKGGHVFAKNSCQLAAWNKLPYVGSFLGWVEADKKYRMDLLKWEPLTTHYPYQGEHISPFDESINHNWDDYYYLWISNTDLAYKLEKDLRLCTKGNLSAWREAIIAVETDKRNKVIK